MKKTPMKFWASCPHCKKKFGIEPKFITMYLKRVIEEYKDRFSRVSDMLEEAQKEVAVANKKRES